MCGINGFNFENETLIRRMNERTRHRGPDGEGVFVDKVSLGHNRLSIIDLSENGKQPMSNENGTVWVVFNGEIYNFKEIKEELNTKHYFKSETDTEIILHAYEEWGFDCVNKFNGMWAFAIYDKNKNILFLSRDRFGKKPLYYYFDSEKFIFSSEIKSILEHGIKKELNHKAVSSFLSYRYVLGKETFFKNIKKLLPAHNLIFDLDKKQMEEKEYWDLGSSSIYASEKYAKNKTAGLLGKSIKYRKISDVPLGVILSGGLDSSIITSMLAKQETKPINTFTVKFKEEGYDETKFAKEVANYCSSNYHEVLLDTNNFLDLMKEYSAYKDEPIGVPNEVALYLLSKKIKEKVTVVLSGEGADEVFEGYGRKFSAIYDYELLERLKKEKNGYERYSKDFSTLFKKYGGKFFGSEFDHFMNEYSYWSEEEKNLILKKELKEDTSEELEKYFYRYDMPYEQRISYLFLKIHLPGLLNRLDSSTMASAVESRAPFLDKELVEYVFNLPLNLKTKWLEKREVLETLDITGDSLSEDKNISKYILKEIAKEHLPKHIVERKKVGFPLPLDNWLKEEFEELLKRYLLSEESKIKELVNQEALKSLINNPISNKRFGQKLWMLLSLELWLREWFPEINIKKEVKPIIVFCGLMGSGKTFFSKRLMENITDYERFNTDEVRRMMGFKEFDRKDTPKVNDYMYSNARKILKDGKGVMFDSAYKLKEAREKIYEMGKELDIPILVVECSASPEISIKRIGSRVKSDDLHNPTNKPEDYIEYVKIWENPELDLKENENVSLIKINSETNELQEIKINEDLKSMLEEIRKKLNLNRV